MTLKLFLATAVGYIAHRPSVWGVPATQGMSPDAQICIFIGTLIVGLAWMVFIVWKLTK